MSYPKKRRGHRTLTLGERQYRWKLSLSSSNNWLVVTGIKYGCQRLEIKLPDWDNPWQAIPGIKVHARSLTLFSAAAKAPVVVASGFVRELIEFGLSNGWNPEGSTQPMCVEYIDGRPTLCSSVLRSAGKKGALPEEPAGQ